MRLVPPVLEYFINAPHHVTTIEPIKRSEGTERTNETAKEATRAAFEFLPLSTKAAPR